MKEAYQILIGVAILGLGIPIGSLLARWTKEELKMGKFWFKILISLSLVGALIFLILGNDAILFGLLFIAIVTSRCIKR